MPAREPLTSAFIPMIYFSAPARKLVSTIALAAALAATPRSAQAAPSPIVHRARVMDQTGSWNEVVRFWEWAEQNGYAGTIYQANANRRARYAAAAANASSGAITLTSSAPVTLTLQPPPATVDNAATASAAPSVDPTAGSLTLSGASLTMGNSNGLSAGTLFTGGGSTTLSNGVLSDGASTLTISSNLAGNAVLAGNLVTLSAANFLGVSAVNTGASLTIASGVSVKLPTGFTLNNVNNVGGIVFSNGLFTNNSGLTLAGTLSLGTLSSGTISSGTILTQGGGTLTIVPSNLLVTATSENILSPLVTNVANPVQIDPGTVAPADSSVAPEVTAVTAPEPSTALSLAFGVAILLGRCRRRAV